jgi:hypothetical protein
MSVGFFEGSGLCFVVLRIGVEYRISKGSLEVWR